jgi:archaellum biogenesis ATPase FlaH
MTLVAAIKPTKELYGLATAFESALVFYLCSSTKTYARIGQYVEADCLAQEPARLAIAAVRQMAFDTQEGPGSVTLVIQRLKRWQADGKITNKDVVSVHDFLSDAEDAGLPDEEKLIAEISPILKRRAEREVLEAGLSEWQRKGDISVVLAKLEKAKHIGIGEVTIGSRLGPKSFDEIARLKKRARLSTRILELDDVLKGGPPRGCLCTVQAASGGGKSMYLAHQSVAAALQGFLVAFVTLEVSKEVTNARLIANLTGVEIDMILDAPYTCGAMEKLDKYLVRPDFGHIEVAQMSPKVTTPNAVFEWVKTVEKQYARQVDLLVVDYADKMSANHKVRDANTYATQGSVYDELFTWARDGNRWCWTASQAKRGDTKDKAKIIGNDHVSDSLGKVRSSDLFMSVNDMGEGMVIINVSKFRHGKEGRTPELPTNFECARIAPVLVD